MAILVLIILLCAFCAWLIARSMYKINVKGNYKNPWLGPVIVFVIMLALFLFVIFLLLGSMFQR